MTPLNRQRTPLLTRGEEDRSTPLNTRGEKNRQASTQRSSFLTQGDKTQSRRQQQSVLGQKLEGQHICRDRSPDPASVREWTVGPSGHTYRLLEHYKTDTNKVYIFVQENKIQTETNLHPRLPSQSNG